MPEPVDVTHIRHTIPLYNNKLATLLLYISASIALLYVQLLEPESAYSTGCREPGDLVGPPSGSIQPRGYLYWLLSALRALRAHTYKSPIQNVFS